MTDNCSVNVGYYGDQLYAMTETNAIRRIDAETLNTIGEKTVISKYVAINHATAHPHVCKDGTVYNIGTSYQHSRGPHYVVVKVPPTFGSKGKVQSQEFYDFMKFVLYIRNELRRCRNCS